MTRRTFALVAENRKVTVADDLISDARGKSDVTIVFQGGSVRPGLINAHDHLHRNHFPRLGRPPYRDAYEWGEDIHDRWADAIRATRQLPRREALLFGALKNLLGATTTVVHHDPWEDDFEDFPVRVPRVRIAHSLRLGPDPLAAMASEPDAARVPFAIHLAEGHRASVGGEVRAAANKGLLGPCTIAVHVTGVSDEEIRTLERTGTGVCWCPTSNRYLFDTTVPEHLFRHRIDVLLGTDALLTGDGTMLDELRAGRTLGFLEDDRLLAASGAVAARRLMIPEPSLEPGHPADLVVLRRPLWNADASDVMLVLVAGLPRLGHPGTAELFEYCGVPSETLIVGGETRFVAAPLGRIAHEVMAMCPECARIVTAPPAQAAVNLP